jgi:hypothetical protein
VDWLEFYKEEEMENGNFKCFVYFQRSLGSEVKAMRFLTRKGAEKFIEVESPFLAEVSEDWDFLKKESDLGNIELI